MVVEQPEVPVILSSLLPQETRVGEEEGINTYSNNSHSNLPRLLQDYSL
jgi:hypothetical protein